MWSLGLLWLGALQLDLIGCDRVGHVARSFGENGFTDVLVRVCRGMDRRAMLCFDLAIDGGSRLFLRFERDVVDTCAAISHGRDRMFVDDRFARGRFGVVTGGVLLVVRAGVLRRHDALVLVGGALVLLRSALHGLGGSAGFGRGARVLVDQLGHAAASDHRRRDASRGPQERGACLKRHGRLRLADRAVLKTRLDGLRCGRHRLHARRRREFGCCRGMRRGLRRIDGDGVRWGGARRWRGGDLLLARGRFGERVHGRAKAAQPRTEGGRRLARRQQAGRRENVGDLGDRLVERLQRLIAGIAAQLFGDAVAQASELIEHVVRHSVPPSGGSPPARH